MWEAECGSAPRSSPPSGWEYKEGHVPMATSPSRVGDRSGAAAGRGLGSPEGLLGTPGNPVLQWERH